MLNYNKYMNTRGQYDRKTEHYAYGFNETDTVTAMQNARDRSVLDEYTPFETNQLAVISGNEEAIAKTVGNGVINVIENGTPGVAGVKGVVHAGENEYQASQLHDSLWYGVGGALRVDELSERVTSERKTTLEAIWSFGYK